MVFSSWLVLLMLFPWRRGAEKKKVEARFSDSKRPNFSKEGKAKRNRQNPKEAHWSHCLLKEEFGFCTYHGLPLDKEDELFCEECGQKFAGRRVILVASGCQACVVDARASPVAWRRRMFCRISPPYNADV
jgi:hypothetical protein